jgi:hypothetical protein
VQLAHDSQVCWRRRSRWTDAADAEVTGAHIDTVGGRRFSDRCRRELEPAHVDGKVQPVNVGDPLMLLVPTLPEENML